MKTYQISVREVHTQIYEVNAENPKKAVEILNDSGLDVEYMVGFLGIFAYIRH